MIKVVIVSEDTCLINRILYTIQEINSKILIQLYNPKDIKLEEIEKSNLIYLIDIYHLENNILNLLKTLTKNPNNKVIILSMNQNLRSILSSYKGVSAVIEKSSNLERSLKNTLLEIFHSKENNLQISNRKIPVSLNSDQIDHYYHYPNDQLSFHYNDGKNTILISKKETTNSIQNLSQEAFYQDKKTWKNNQKRQTRTDPVKQIIVDLYSVGKMECTSISHHFQVDPKTIKRWAGLLKYNQRCYLSRYIMGKLIIKYYFKK